MTDFDNGHYSRGTAAGHKGNTETGRAAAEHVNETLGRRHQQMLDAWADFGKWGATPEMIAAKLGLPVHIVRPRAGELVKRWLLFVVGKSPGEFGCDVRRYSAVKPQSLDEATLKNNQDKSSHGGKRPGGGLCKGGQNKTDEAA